MNDVNKADMTEKESKISNQVKQYYRQVAFNTK